MVITTRIGFSLARAAILALALMLMAACSSDGSSDDTDLPEGVLTGSFVDSPVSGLMYRTSSGMEGMTNASGEFLYLPGDTIEFLLGVISLGSVTGAPTLTPFDLVGYDLQGQNLSLSDIAVDIAAADLSDSVTNFEQGVNLLILLQSLDRNNSPGDGIEIASSVFQFFTTILTTLLFNVETGDFIASFFNIFLQLVTGGFLDRADGELPVDREQALIHFLSNT